jgi:hypothetical protein
MMETYRGFIIKLTDPVPPIPNWQQFKFEYTHRDYDGAEDARDNRHGFGPTVMDCKRQIDDLLDEAAA